MPEQPLSIVEAASKAGVSEETIRNKIRSGDLNAEKTGPRRSYRIQPKQFQKWFNNYKSN